MNINDLEKVFFEFSQIEDTSEKLLFISQFYKELNELPESERDFVTEKARKMMQNSHLKNQEILNVVKK